MTPFVGVALLLIVFFVWMKRLQLPVVREVHGPIRGKFDRREPLHTSLFLLDQNKVGFLAYHPENGSADYVETDYSTSGLRMQLARTSSQKRPMLVIKPTAASTYKNLVDVVDEVAIHVRIQYGLEYALTPDEQQMLSAYQGYKRTHPRQPVLMRLPRYQYTSVSETK